MEERTDGKRCTLTCGRLGVAQPGNLKRGNDMSRKHYQMLAKLIQQLGVDINVHRTGVAYNLFLDALCEQLKIENPNFDEKRFRQATENNVFG